MKIYVIIANYWNGENDSISVVGTAYTNEEEAKAWVLEMNSKRTSSYSTDYYYEEVELK